MGFLKLLSVSLASLALVNAGELLSASDADSVTPGSYIVVMNEGVSDADFNAHREAVGTTASRMSRGQRVGSGMNQPFDINGMRGYSASFDDAIVRDIANRPEVKYVEPDQIMRASELVTQRNPPSWGLSRISSKSSNSTNYVYDSTAGDGVVVYSVDTGVDIKHPDFEGRAEWGTNTIDNDDTDGAGHGTHTSSTMVGKDFGVAKKASLVAVKVLGADGSGSTSKVLAGMEWAVKDAKSRGITGKKAVMNMSLGGPYSQAMNDGAANVIRSGVFLAVAAGNESNDASNVSPASLKEACTVAASTMADGNAPFSNFGSVVDIYAPGAGITAAVPGGGSGTKSGTSMAAPHVAGVAAYLMALEGISTDEACARMVELAPAAITNAPSGTTNKLLFNGVKA